jgi:hypothetical protein
MTMFSVEESRAMDEKLLAQLTDEWQRASEVAKSVGCSLTMARDRLIRLALTDRCQWTVHRFREGVNGTYVYRAATAPAGAEARNDD